MRFHWNIAAFFILLYFELVKGNPEHWSAPVDISSHHFVHLFWGTLSLIFGAGATVGVVVVEGVGQQHASLCADRKSTRLNSSHSGQSRMPSSA